MDADVIVIGHGLAGLVASAELADAGRRVLLLDQENAANLGGQAFWSFGGLLFVDSPEQRRMGIKDSTELLWQDWEATAGWDRLTHADGSPGPDHWGREWARAYVDFASGEKRAWLHEQGMRWFPIVGWAERGERRPGGIGNTVPRFHVTWGTGPGVVEPFERRVRAHLATGRIVHRPRHRVDEVVVSDGAVTGVRGAVLAADFAERGKPSTRDVAADFELTAQAVVVTSGGIGANHDLVRANWPERLGPPPADLITGVPAHVDGRMLAITESAGGAVVNRDRMWHYVEGVHNWSPIWPDHAIRILSGPSSMWLDATGQRLPAPLFPGYDTLGTLEHLRHTGHDHSWFVSNRSLVGKEFTLSGSEQNPDLTNRSIREVLRRPVTPVYPTVQAFLDHGVDFVQADTVAELVARMNALTGQSLLSAADVERQVRERDAAVDSADAEADAQVAAIRVARGYRGDKLTKRAYPLHRILDPKYGPLVAVRLGILTRKTLGGLHTDLSSRVLGASGEPVPGLYAAGEVAGFGGGGLHGYRALEGTFLGGCIYSGRVAGRAAAAATA